MSARFNIQTVDPVAVDILQRTLGLPRFIAATLIARGLDTPQAARDFLSPSLERDWLNPYDISGMQDVVDGLETAVKDGRKILVFGDFDLDGISATATLTRALRILGADAVPFVPLRSEEGYGLTEAAINRFEGLSPDVVVTVDCGIACREEVKMLQHRGVEVFITDHHEPADLVPIDVPVCDPKLDAHSPSSILAGVGVALKLVQALGARFGQPHLWREYTDLATLGTVADLMPMRADNRALVADGVRRMNAAPRPSIAALLASAGALDKPVAATSLSFSIIPRLNAAGRMGDAQLALDLLLTDDFDEASAKAAELESVNDQRRAIEAELVEIAALQAQEVYHGQRALVVSGEGWHEGVKGIVASRLVRTYGVPVLLFTIEDGQARGSGRSVGSVNLFKAVESCSDMLIRFGGHEAAVGVTLPADKLPEFAERLCVYMDGLSEECFHPRIDIDARIDLGELTLDNVAKLERMAPFGQENRQPRFLARDVLLTRCRAVGADKNHFSCTLTDGRHSVAGIMFHCTDIEMLMQCDSVVNAAFELQIDEWRGRKSVKAMLSTLAPVKPCAALEACLEPEHKSFVAELYATSDADLCADCPECREDMEAYEAECEKNRIGWEQRAQNDPEGLRRAIAQAFIGPDHHLHEAQKQVLEYLDAGESVLAVMATGRGKSLTFQMHAAVRALAGHDASLFVYPLRALIADQAFHINQALEPFGIVSEVLTGESTPEERRSIFAGLSDGSVDIVLTTPEFLGYHADEFRDAGRIRFVVVDEAHHIGQAKAGNRIAYAHISKAVDNLGDPVVLALTATADSQVADAITESLHIRRRVMDRSCRPNMQLDDQRNLKKREPYLANLIASGEKTVIYVNSRQQSVTLARMLRKQVPQMAPLIGFYNAGLTRVERVRVEDLFRRGSLCVLVSTAAFGEGVNIPDIRHVVLFHMPFNEIEFNQMSGRAGRDGRPAMVHMLFGVEDAQINDYLLAEATPDHDTLAQVYRQLRAIQKKSGHKPFETTNVALAEACSKQVPAHTVSPSSIACALAVFRELGLIEMRAERGEGQPQHRIRLCAEQGKVELTDSVRYREGLDEIEIFHSFRTWVLDGTGEVLRSRISRPILPDGESMSEEGTPYD